MAEDFAKSVRDMKGYVEHFCLSPERWRQYRSAEPLTWRQVKFEAANRRRIPKVRGVYAFVLEPDRAGFPPHGYLMYVGITGELGSYTLWDRYADYLNEVKTRKRARIHYMLTNWPDNLRFYFSGVPGRKRLGLIETSLNDALLPPYNTNDFSAEIRPRVRALR